MKKPGVENILISPEPEGWRVHLGASASQRVETLAGAVDLLPAARGIHLALPGRLVLLERLTLPTTDLEEIAGMVQLQLEKTVPYPLEEVSSGFSLISQTETESTVLSIAANAAQLDLLCEPLRQRGRLPLKITLFAMHVAATCPAGEVVLCLWGEGGQTEVAICERGKLGFAGNGPGSGDLEGFLAGLPQILLSAEMEGVATNFSRVRLGPGCGAFRESLAALLEVPVEEMSFEGAMPVPELNLAPLSWQAEAHRRNRSARLRQQLQIAAVVYLLTIAGAFLYLAWIKNKVRHIERELAGALPQVEFVQTRQSKWEALAPAIDASRSMIELMYQVFSNRPSDELKITTFEFKPAQFHVEGEAPSPTLAIDFAERLRAQEPLSPFRIEGPPPSILPGGSARFSITGKL